MKEIMKSTALIFVIIISVVVLMLRKASCAIPESHICSVARIADQSKLDLFMRNISLYDNPNANTTKCIQLSFVGSIRSFKLDLVQLMRINLGTNGSLTISGNTINIYCSIINVTDIEELRKLLRPISRALLVLFDGLVFTRCPVPIVIEEVANVIIQNCVFVDHEHGAVNIFNSPNVIVKNCTFYNNTSDTYFTRKPYQSNAGGLSVGYNSLLTTVSLNYMNLTIYNSNFTNNHAGLPASPNEVQESRIFSGRGGGLSLVVNATGIINCIVNNSIFVSNFAENLGGGVYISISEYSALQQFYLFANNVFISNAASYGGAFFFANLVIPSIDFSQNIVVFNSVFTENKAEQIGGGIYIFSSLGLGGSFIKIEKCGFFANTAGDHGGAVDVESFNLYGSRQNQSPVELVGCVFDSNHGSGGGTISLIYFSGEFNDVRCSNHKGPVVRVVAGEITFSGPAVFVDNDVDTFDGGVIYLLSFSQIILTPNAHLNFTNNVGRTGAAIVVNSRYAIPSVFENSYFNPLCFIQYYNSIVPPNQWYQVSMNFTGNRAVIGSTIYSSSLALCSWYSYFPPYFNVSSGLRWPFMSYGNRNINTGHGVNHSTDESFAVQTPAVNFTVVNKTIAAYPGESIKLVIMSYDEQNYATSDTIQILESVQSIEFSLTFTPTADTLQPADSTFNVKYKLRSRSRRVTELIFQNTYSVEVSALRAHSSQVQYFNLTVTPCPPGHVLLSTDEEDEYECQCDDNNDENIVSCLPEESSIVLMEGYWANHVDDESINGMLEYYQCPPGYCQCSRVDNDSSRCNSIYYYDDDDRQCVCDREGLLCGQCRNGKGVSALLNKCVLCGRTSVLLIIALVIVDIIVITTILLCSLSVKPWLYPFLFYLQVTPYLAQYFPVTFSAIQPYLYYISSAVSLYFPYDFCLYPGMTALVSYSFRYIPLLLTVIISTLLYGANKYFKVGKDRRLSWSGLWVLLLLISADILNTSVSILNCPSLSDSDGKKKLRWFVDGSVKCFTGGHLPLAIVAILILMFYILLIAFVTATAMKKIKSYWGFSMTAILRDPYTSQCCWWAPAELLRRFLFILLINIIPGNLALLLLSMMILVTLYIFTMPYKKRYINMLESFVLIDLTILLMVALTEQFKDQTFRNLSLELIDECGRVNIISEHVAMMIPFYYIPLLLLLIVLVVKLSVKIKAIYKTRVNHQKDSSSDKEMTSTLTKTAVTTYYLEMSTM